MVDVEVIAWVTVAPAEDPSARPAVSRRHLRRPGAERTLCGTPIPSGGRVRVRIALSSLACKSCERTQSRRSGAGASPG